MKINPYLVLFEGVNAFCWNDKTRLIDTSTDTTFARKSRNYISLGHCHILLPLVVVLHNRKDNNMIGFIIKQEEVY